MSSGKPRLIGQGGEARDIFNVNSTLTSGTHFMIHGFSLPFLAQKLHNVHSEFVQQFVVDCVKRVCSRWLRESSLHESMQPSDDQAPRSRRPGAYSMTRHTIYLLHHDGEHKFHGSFFSFRA